MITLNNSQGDYNLKLQLTQELDRAVRGQKLNQELYDYLMSTIQYILKTAKDRQIELPKPQNLAYSLERIHALMDAVNTNHGATNRQLTRRNTTDKLPEPDIGFCYLLG